VAINRIEARELKNKIMEGIVKICKNGIVKNFNKDGSRNLDYPTSFYKQGDKKWYIQNGYKII